MKVRKDRKKGWTRNQVGTKEERKKESQQLRKKDRKGVMNKESVGKKVKKERRELRRKGMDRSHKEERNERLKMGKRDRIKILMASYSTPASYELRQDDVPVLQCTRPRDSPEGAPSDRM